MIEEDKKRFSDGMRLLFATLAPGHELDEERLYGYWVGLVNKLSIDAFESAVGFALEECERVPAPVELKRLGQRSMLSAYKKLPSMSREEKKKIRESWPERGSDGKK